MPAPTYAQPGGLTPSFGPPGSLSPSQIGSMGGLAPQGGIFGRSGVPAPMSWPSNPQYFAPPQNAANGAQIGSTVFGAGTGPGLQVNANGMVTLPNGQSMTGAQYGAYGTNYNPGIHDSAYQNVMGPGPSQGQYAVGNWSNGQWQPETNPYALQDWSSMLGTSAGNIVNPSGGAGALSNGWSGTQPSTAAQGAASGMMGTGGMNSTGMAAALGLPPAGTSGQAAASGMMGTGGMNRSPYAGSSGDMNGTMAGIPGMPSGQSSPAAAQSTFGPYQNFIPPSQNYNFNPGGGYMPTPVGGYWNQTAQQMAGPMFGPQGSSVTMGAANGVSPAQVSAQTVPGYNPGATTPTPTTTTGGSSLGALGSLSGISNLPLAQQLAYLRNPYGFGGASNPFSGIRPMQY